MKIIIYIFLGLILLSCNSEESELLVTQEINDEIKENQNKIDIDSTEQENNIFKGYEYANFKLNYYVSEGYSHIDRYWYEVIIIDSLLVLNYQCPKNDDWDYIYYQKQIILDDEKLNFIQLEINAAKLYQKNEGFPYWSDWAGSGYGENRLYIESENLNVSGGMIYNCMGNGEEDFDKLNRKQSTTIGGHYEPLFSELEKLFVSLPFLMEDKKRKF